MTNPSDQSQSAAEPAGDYQLGRAYYDLFGEVPAHARARWEIIAAAGRPDTVTVLEQLRATIISESPMELRVQQMVQFGQLVALRAEAPAKLHARAALRHGATIEELMGIVETAYLTAGITAFSMGVAIIGELLPNAKG